MTRRELRQKTIAVVGASGAFGQRFVTSLNTLGANVVAGARDVSALDFPDGVVTETVNVTNPKAGHVLAEVAQSAFGSLDGVINATGTVGFGNLADTSEASIEELMLVNAVGPLWLTKNVAPALADSQGFILHISGVVSEKAFPGMSAYCASKSALAAGLASARRELRRSKVDVIDARPPHTETGLATRPLFGTAPTMPNGLNPDDVVGRMLQAVQNGEKDIPSDAF